MSLADITPPRPNFWPLPPTPLPPIPPGPSSVVVALPPDAADPVAERLFERRTLLVGGTLDDRLATRTAAALMTLDATGDDPVTVQLSTAEGELTAALAVADTIDLMGVEVRVRCVGMVGGPALAVLAAADRRTAAPHARLRLSEPSVHVAGTATRIGRDAEAHVALLDILRARLARATGRTIEAITEDLRGGRFLSPAEAVGYGLLHEVESVGSTGVAGR